MEKQEKNTASPYELDGRPPLKVAIPLGLQHVLAMFVGNLTPLLIITAACGIEAGGDLQVALLQNAMLIAGIVTLVQVFTIGTGRWQASYRYGNKFRLHRRMSECCRSHGKWRRCLWFDYGSLLYRRSF